MPRRGRKRLRSKSAPPSIDSRRPKRRKNWSNEAMLAALEAVKSGTSVKRAAAEHGVPRTTLQDRHLGRVVHGVKPGPKSYLTCTEERELGEFVEVVGQIGYGKTRKQIKNIAESVARDKGVLRSNRISDGWFRRFLERQPQLCLRKGDATATVRMDAMDNNEALENYFKLLKDLLEENGLMDQPGQIYNVDESGMPFEHRPPRVLARKGQRKVRCRTSGNKSQVTVIGCVSAAGQAIPPFVIYDAKSLNMEWTKGEVPGTTYGLSNRGWVDMELFKGWLSTHFLKFAVASRPLLLLLDGHSSHYNPEAIRHAKDSDVIMFTLVPHTTHEMQPLDTAVFGPLKVHWREACHDFVQANPGKVITKYHFSSLLNTAWMKTMVPQTIISGFRTCGVYPFNPQAVLDRVSFASPSGSEQVDRSSESPPASPSGSEQVDQSTESPPVPDLDTAPEECLSASSEPKSPVYSPAEEELFERRYEEKYDLYDPKYMAWLARKHPEAVHSNVVPVEEDVLSLNSSTDLETSVTDFFAHVSPAQELPLKTPPNCSALRSPRMASPSGMY